jgi:hypothetical protein
MMTAGGTSGSRCSWPTLRKAWRAWYNDAEYSDDRAHMMLWGSDELDALLAEAEKAEVDELLAP